MVHHGAGFHGKLAGGWRASCRGQHRLANRPAPRDRAVSRLHGQSRRSRDLHGAFGAARWHAL
ncbi:hypothetical protein DL1_02550 [Thioclava dalianensis]|uniref:Uncharacterized protein n=1 Tax=Thioclava dalianensis TaxID=1185766 RepID=A0A074THT7_9RHOB|nr:hypothetical protein DL1_02550 [Thioclava dalianensis]